MTTTIPTDYTWPIPSYQQLVQFSGQDIAELYTDESFAEYAIQMSADWFFMATGLAGPPASGFETRLLTYAILAMTQAIYLAQPFKAVLASPFSSEHIGNYSYSKIAGAAATGMPTGIDIYDQAVQYFVAGTIPESTATRGMEDDNIWVESTDPEGTRQLLGPRDFEPSPFGGVPIPKGYGQGFNDTGFGGGVWPQP